MAEKTARQIRVLGLETSCDDTAAAVVRGQLDEDGVRPPGWVLSDTRYGQNSLHAVHGGVVPEIAARAHAEKADLAVQAALDGAGLKLDNLDAIAVTAGPGLAPGLLAGVMTACGLALGSGLPLHSVNHLEAHALTVRLERAVAFPYLLLLASGGHCLLAVTSGAGRHQVLGSTLDDAAGEAFDKVARLLDLGFPGGPAVEAAAEHGDSERFGLPRPLAGRPGCEFSFSGLKTAVMQVRDRLADGGRQLSDVDSADLAASFQAAVRDSLVDRAVSAMRLLLDAHPSLDRPAFAGAGGVLANRAIRAALQQAAEREGFACVFPDPSLCTDNGAMVAWAAVERIGCGLEPGPLPVRARWPLDDSAAV